MLKLWPTDGREHLKQLTTDLPLWYKYIILYIKNQAFQNSKIFPSCPENNCSKSRTRRIQRPASPRSTTRDNQLRMEGMERAGDNIYT
jgi:hypothetical protein